MADNRCVPSISPVSKNDSSEQNLGSFTTLLGSSSAIGGAIKRERDIMMIDHPKPTTTNCDLISTPPSQPPPTSGHTTLLREDLDNTSPPFKRARVRPIGSKNKPKPPITIKEESDCFLKLTVIEIPPGNDVISSLINFSRQQRVNLIVLGASGTVSDIHIDHPPTLNGAPTFPYHRAYNMISLSGTCMYSNLPHDFSTIANNPKNFMIYFTGTHGVVYSRIVAGKLMAASAVVVKVAVSKSHEYHRVPSIDGNMQGEKVVEHASTFIGGHNSADPISTMSAYVVAGGSSQLPPQPPSGGDANAM